METPISLLCVEDSPHDIELIKTVLAGAGIKCTVHRVDRPEALAAALRDQRIDLILSDFSLPGYDGLSALDLARRLRPDIPFIFVSGTIGEEVAVESLQRGAIDYVLKNRLDRLPAAVRRALREIDEGRERERAEKRIQELAALLDKARDAICLMDLDQTILYWNQGSRLLYGWKPEQALGRNANDLLFGGETSASLDAIKSLMARGEWQGELHQVARDGRKILAESRWTLRRDDTGRPLSILVINTDVTEKKKLEREFLRAQRFESIGALSSGVAHDLNNVLAPILMASDLLLAQVPDGEGRQLLDMIKASAQRGSELVRQILSFASGAGSRRQIVQVRHLAEETAQLIRDTFPRSIEIRSEMGRDLRPVMGDATQFQQILLNLCVNARDAMPGGGVLTLRVENKDLDAYATASQPAPRSGPFLLVTVSDTGTGISEEVASRIFEPFFTTKEPSKGTGLGLSTVLSIIESHHGMVEVETRPGQGTTFSIYIPATEAEEGGVAAPRVADVPRGNGERVLVVEDEAAILEITRGTLEYYGYTVIPARHGADALSLFRQATETIDLVITDMMMPVMDGPTLIGELRKASPSVRVICVSGLGSTNQLGDAHKGVVRASLMKPYAAETLLRAMRQVLDMP